MPAPPATALPRKNDVIILLTIKTESGPSRLECTNRQISSSFKRLIAILGMFSFVFRAERRIDLLIRIDLCLEDESMYHFFAGFAESH